MGVLGQYRVPPVAGGSGVISAVGVLGRRAGNAAPASRAWNAANEAMYIPFVVVAPVIAHKIVVGAGATASGNFDAGILDSQGRKLVSTGATAKVASAEQVIDIADTLLIPGLHYMALAADGTNNYALGSSRVQALRLAGVVKQASAYPLPSVATFATLGTGTSTYNYPGMAIYVRAA